jgi:rhodanese-related sulfurtransferase
MNMREKFSVLLLFLGLILALLPLSGNRSFVLKPDKLLSEITGSNPHFTVDQVARFIVLEDSTVQLIDLRSPEEFKNFNIPGSVNIPYKELLDKDPSVFPGSIDMKKIFYSNGDFDSNFAVVIAAGLGYKNNYTMKGGLNEWFITIMNSEFKGEKISARENALFETRTKARKLFTEINSLPDSLKLKMLKSRHFDPKKLDGGCE